MTKIKREDGSSINEGINNNTYKLLFGDFDKEKETQSKSRKIQKVQGDGSGLNIAFPFTFLKTHKNRIFRN